MSQPRTRSIIASIDNLCARHQDNRAFMKKVFYIGAGLMAYGFIWLLWYGYQYAIADSHQYAQLAIITVSAVALASGAWWCTVYRRWTFSDESAARLHALKLTIKGGIPMVVVVLAMSLGVFSQAIVWDNYMVVKVRATDEVKEELKWLLGDRYPYEDEVNIDPLTLEWEFETVGSVNSSQSWLLEAMSVSGDPEYKTRLAEKQLNIQTIQVLWEENSEEIVRAIELDWGKTHIASFPSTDDELSYPMCDLSVPIKDELSDAIDYEIYINGVEPTTSPYSKTRLVDHRARLDYLSASWLPKMFRVENGNLIIRTNFLGSRWLTYCAVNYPHNKVYRPEPITWYSLSDLNRGEFGLHFYLFEALLKNTLDARYERYRRLGTYGEFIEELDKRVAHRIIRTGRSGFGGKPIHAY